MLDLSTAYTISEGQITTAVLVFSNWAMGSFLETTDMLTDDINAVKLVASKNVQGINSNTN